MTTYKKWDIAQMDRHWDTPTGGKLFAIDLPLISNQYKNDNIANFVYYGKTRMPLLQLGIGQLINVEPYLKKNYFCCRN